MSGRTLAEPPYRDRSICAAVPAGLCGCLQRSELVVLHCPIAAVRNRGMAGAGDVAGLCAASGRWVSKAGELGGQGLAQLPKAVRVDPAGTTSRPPPTAIPMPLASPSPAVPLQTWVPVAAETPKMVPLTFAA
jgi:hypothetical protein